MNPGGPLSSRLGAAVLGVAILAAVALGGGVGARLGAWASEAPVEALVLPDPSTASALPAHASRSAGGFSGFGGPPALQGEVLRSGVIAESGAGSLTLVEAGGAARVDYASPLRLFRIERAKGPLQPGQQVVVRLADAGTAAAVLIIPGATP